MRKPEKFNIYRLNIISALLFMVMGVIICLTIQLGLGRPLHEKGWGYIIIFMIITFSTATFLHEGLHGVGHMLFNKVQLRDLKFGITQLAPYCSCGNIPLTKYGMIGSCLLPSVALGTILMIYTIATTTDYCWPVLTAFTIASGTGDYAYVLRLLKYPKTVVIYDLVKDIGFEVEVPDTDRG